MSELLEKVLQAVEPDGDEGWIEWALNNYYELCSGFTTDRAIINLAAEELDKLRSRVSYLKKKLVDVKSMQEEECEW